MKPASSSSEATPTARCLELKLMDGPSNSSLWTSWSTVLRALRGGAEGAESEPLQVVQLERLESATYVPEVVLWSGVWELLITLEMMVTTVEASEPLILATSTSCFTLLTTLDTCRTDRQTGGRGGCFSSLLPAGGAWTH